MENYFIPYPKEYRVNILKYVKFWRNQSLRGDLMDKGGSFNINLYLDYLDVIQNQPIEYVKKSR
jgi:hypothetical protein